MNKEILNKIPDEKVVSLKDFNKVSNDLRNERFNFLDNIQHVCFKPFSKLFTIFSMFKNPFIEGAFRDMDTKEVFISGRGLREFSKRFSLLALPTKTQKKSEQIAVDAFNACEDKSGYLKNRPLSPLF
jgi:hypothetical protein